MKLVAGLGNPGVRYAFTRHNVGFWVLDVLERRGWVSLNRYMHRALCGRGRIDSKEVFFARPITYMNRSGEALVPLLRYLGLGAGDLLVVYDDVALPTGRLRLRGKGSAGGHKGIASIIGSLGTDEFSRLRIGVGPLPPGMDLPDFVLSKFSDRERREMGEVVEEAAGAVELFVTAGLMEAMNRYNAPT
ncbi:MAG: aminoacyl-tRNA hydrolase [Firmicutes bacterium]|nr:aminoacyl-tRNA hydrolase [Bacillota bacterium]